MPHKNRPLRRASRMQPFAVRKTGAPYSGKSGSGKAPEAASINNSNREAKSALYAHSLFSLRMKQTTIDKIVLMSRSAAMTKFSGASPGMPKQTTPVK